MKNSMRRVAIITDALARGALWVAGIGLVLMTVFIAAQVFWRYLLGSSLMWSEPVSVMIMGWFIFLGAAVGIKEGYHLSFDVLLYVIPERGKKLFYSLSDLAVTAFGAGMMWYGTSLAINASRNIIPSIGISGAFDFLPVAIGGLLVVLFSIERIARRLADLPTARFGDAALEE
ncbi:TRAP transporter small permease [Allorhizobium taibaishanense]|uniref:TRAP transporter small permease protein n=1 Tax=Allorhizobium taibaishanense TaxID=887144 RepID=A0A1Q9A598_9HYPH|nr:TRAP transporter small permease [Allorhizobium taibaishanense]MBB4006844.1 TRAP-type C4-dicarboxylate transport system permease small subunit [Allorhizobium taibaishanense]OLP49728.1 C4-dicarboxylate ABC transporter [Allorhizobium taibaishanense]